MAICLIQFPNGHVLRSRWSDEKKLLPELTALARLKAGWATLLPVGDTPLVFPQFNNNCDWSVTVYENGKGVLYATLKNRDTVIQDSVTLEDVTVTGLKEGDQAYRMPDDKPVCVIGGPNKKSKVCVFAIVFYSEGTTPAEIQSAISSHDLGHPRYNFFTSRQLFSS